MYGDLFTTEINTRIFKGTNFTTNVFEEITVEERDTCWHQIVTNILLHKW